MRIRAQVRWARAAGDIREESHFSQREVRMYSEQQPQVRWAGVADGINFTQIHQAIMQQIAVNFLAVDLIRIQASLY